MCFPDQETVQYRDNNGNVIPGLLGEHPTSGSHCTIYRDGVAIGTCLTTGEETWFADYDVIPGMTYTYEVVATNKNTGMVRSSGPRNITCYFLYHIEFGAAELSFVTEGGRVNKKDVPVSLLMQDSNSSVAVSFNNSYKISCDRSDAWMSFVFNVVTLNLSVWVQPNETDMAREGTITISYRGAISSVRIVQEAKKTIPPEVLSAIDAIDAIGEVSYTAESKDRIDAARAAYDALTDEQKGQVSNYETLTAAETAYGEFETTTFDQYKEDQLAVVAAMLADGDSESCAALVASAESDIVALAFDHAKTLDANKEAVDAIVTKLAADLAAQREVDKPCYDMLNANDIKEPYVASNAVTITGAMYDGCDVIGIVELKLGKVNEKKKTGKVSGSVTTLYGKKHTIKAAPVTGVDGESPQTVSLEVKDYGTMTVTIGGKQFAGSMGRYHVQSENVGNDWGKGTVTVKVTVGDLSMFSGKVV